MDKLVCLIEQKGGRIVTGLTEQVSIARTVISKHDGTCLLNNITAVYQIYPSNHAI